MAFLGASSYRRRRRVASQRRPDRRFIAPRYGRRRRLLRRFLAISLLFVLSALGIVQFSVQFGKPGRLCRQFFLLGEGPRRFFPGVFQIALQCDQAPLLLFQTFRDLLQRIIDAGHVPQNFICQFRRIGEILLHCHNKLFTL
jgi:hypothetical protein